MFHTLRYLSKRSPQRRCAALLQPPRCSSPEVSHYTQRSSCSRSVSNLAAASSPTPPSSLTPAVNSRSASSAATTTLMPSRIPPPYPTMSVGPSMAIKRPSFYMRQLPADKLVGYDTTAGKELFKQGLMEGGLEAFFPLSQQFLTQNEPAYCGIGTLCMILNGLKVDPGVVWKGPWRWFSEDMLDCCRPLEWVKTNGITLTEFSCLARCNGLDATTRFADQITFEDFERDVISCCRSDSQFMAVSYSRSSLGQTGTGHFSPAGGYCSANGGMVLILDVARFKYPSYWVPIRLLYESLRPIDPSTGQSRGYSILRRSVVPTSPSPLLTLNATTATWPGIYQPLLECAKEAESYDTLLSGLCELLNEPSGPLTPAVISRVEEHNSRLNTSADSMHVHETYKNRIDSLFKHFSANCRLYQQIIGLVDDDATSQVEMTVFVLALFQLEDFVNVMRREVRKEVEESVREDVKDVRILAEVNNVKKQMQGMVSCGKENEGCCGNKTGCCGGKGGVGGLEELLGNERQ